MLRKRMIIKVILYWVSFVISSTISAQTCFDTTLRNRLFLNSDISVVISKYVSQPGGNSFLLSKIWENSSTLFSAAIAKKDAAGNVVWARNINAADSSLNLSQLLELSDKTFFVFGTLQSKLSPFRVAQNPLLLHLDKNGVVINSWRIDLKEPSLINGFFQSFLCQVDANSIALLTNYTSEDFTSAFIVLKLDIATGKSLWANKFYKNNFFYANGMIASGNELIIAGNFSYPVASQEKQGISFIKLISATGTLLLYKSYENTFVNSLVSATDFASFRSTRNGNYNVIYSTSKDKEPNKVVSTSFDDNFNIVQTKAIANINDIYLIRNFSINSSGAFAFGFFNAGNANDQGYVAVDSSFRLLQERKLKPFSGTNFSVAFSNNDLNLADDNKLTVVANVNKGLQLALETVTTNIYNKDTGCIGSNFNEVTVEDFSLQNSAWSLDQENTPLPQLNPFPINDNSLALQQEQICLTVKSYSLHLPDSVSKCNSDSVTLKASPDFVSYNWQPNTYSLQTNDSIVKVFPPSVQNYFVSAQTYWGCTVKDTVKIIPHASPTIQFPNDTSVCTGNTFVIDAGDSFVNYLWNDGTSGRYKTISSARLYTVEATDSNNCSVRDSFRLLQIYPVPIVNIHQKQILCRGQNNQLSTGNYSTYLWQDGSAAQTYSVQDTGIYWVKVKDNNGCENSDTVKITSLTNPPANFIEADTSICSYETIVLKPTSVFTSYLWSDGSTLPYLEIHQSGNYFLKVLDSNGCAGQEQITVKQRNCTNLIVFPSAFTPNGDGLNDQFKPAVKGKILNYNFSIYNRWGQKIFESFDPLKGWNGFYNKSLKTDVFVWLCQYQFEGESRQTKKGTVTLIN